jgi:predicted GNAT family acetyltransferase
MMAIQFHNNNKKGIFFIEDDKKEQIAEMTFVYAGNNTVIFDHTLVNPNYNGQGLGKKLLPEAMKFVEDNNLKIIPLCPFVKKMVDNMPEYQVFLKHR